MNISNEFNGAFKKCMENEDLKRKIDRLEAETATLKEVIRSFECNSGDIIMRCSGCGALPFNDKLNDFRCKCK